MPYNKDVKILQIPAIPNDLDMTQATSSYRLTLVQEWNMSDNIGVMFDTTASIKLVRIYWLTNNARQKYATGHFGSQANRSRLKGLVTRCTEQMLLLYLEMLHHEDCTGWNLDLVSMYLGCWQYSTL